MDINVVNYELSKMLHKEDKKNLMFHIQWFSTSKLDNNNKKKKTFK